MENPNRCPWCLSHPIYVEYHDREWGFPLRDDARQFEFLTLESAQAGLSWLTVLKRREGYRKAYLDFNAERVAGFGPDQVEALLRDSAIIRNRSKIESSINNARCFLRILEKVGSFTDFLLGFSDGRQVVNRWRSPDQVPATTPLSDKISKELKSRGFRFVGSTIVYAHLQATGLVNDHLADCYRYMECIQ